MRVIAGTRRSLNLVTPSGDNTRPTTDRIKETLFNMIQGNIPDCIFIDFFSGSGGIGIEALSRGARFCYFVEKDKNAIDCISKNLAYTKFTDSSKLIRDDVINAVSQIKETANIIFMDPPYDKGFEFLLLDKILTSTICDENTLLILEASIIYNVNEIENLGFEILKEKKYKTNQHIMFQKRIN